MEIKTSSAKLMMVFAILLFTCSIGVGLGVLKLELSFSALFGSLATILLTIIMDDK